MNLRTSRDAALLLFCEEHQAADAVQIVALKGDHVLDIAEFQSEWGPDRTAGVLEWADRAPGDTLHLTALRKTGERCGCDAVWERVGETLCLPAERPEGWAPSGDPLLATMAVSMVRARP